MEFVNLRKGYLLTGFKDFESALAATEILCESGFKVAYLNETKYVQESEIREFTRNFKELSDKKSEKDSFKKLMFTKEKAADDFKIAVELLERKSKHPANFIVVVNTKEVKESNLKTVNVLKAVNVW